MIILDDTGRAALKMGDEVLVRGKISCPAPDADGDLRVSTATGWGWFKPADVFALLPKPIAVGDKLRRIAPLARNVAWVCVGFTQDGRIVAEYDAGDITGVTCADASCWEKVA